MMNYYYLSHVAEEPVFNPVIHPVYVLFSQEKVRGFNSRLYCVQRRTENVQLGLISERYPYLYMDDETGKTFDDLIFYAVPEGEEPVYAASEIDNTDEAEWEYDYESDGYMLSCGDNDNVDYYNIAFLVPLAGRIGRFIHRDHATLVENVGYVTPEMLQTMQTTCNVCGNHYFASEDDTEEICPDCLPNICANYSSCGNISGNEEFCPHCDENERFRPEAVFISEHHPQFDARIIDGWHSAGPSSFQKYLMADEGDDNPTFGFEVEVESRFHNSVVTANSLKINVFDPLDVPVKYCRDGTIAHAQGIEILTHVYDYERLMNFDNFFEAFSRTLIYAYGKHGTSNGLHIHVGLLNWRNDANIKRLQRILDLHANNHGLIEFIAERGETSHWAHIHPNESRNIATSFRHGDNTSSRYVAVNINAHNRMGTIEFRYFKPNLSIKGFKKNIQWMSAIMDYCNRDTDDSIYQYIAQRNAIYPELYEFMQELPEMPEIFIEVATSSAVSDDIDDVLNNINGNGDEQQTDIFSVLADLDDAITRMEGEA